MPVSNRLPTRLVGLGLLCAFCAVTVYGKVRDAERVRPHGRFNELQIMERADAVYSTLMNPAEGLQTTTRRLEREFRDGSLHPFWYIDYSDAAGNSVLRLGFDGETGHLHFAGLHAEKNSVSLAHFARPGHLTSAAKVLKLSRDWVYAMNLAPKMGPWNVISLPKQIGTTWYVRWQCRDHTLHFSFDQKTGHLIMAQVRV